MVLKLVRRDAKIYERKKAGELYLEISGKNLSKELNLGVGDKIINQVTIPKWIFDNMIFIRSCLRGLFDTDGSCYKTGKKYLIINFTNHNQKLLVRIYKGLQKLGFHPYYKKSKRDVELGRQLEIRKFFSIIAPRNKKHYRFLAG